MADRTAAPSGEARPAARTVTLVAPLLAGDTVITAVTLSKPTFAALKGLEMAKLLNMDVAVHARLWARISELTPDLVEQLDPADVAQLAGTTMLFFATPPQLAIALREMGAEPPVTTV